MKTLISTPTHAFSPDKAVAIAKACAAGDPDWEYRVVHCPKGTGLSFVEIYDEDGEFVGRV